HGLRKRRDLARLSVVADRVGVIQGTVAQVGVAPFCRHALIGVEVGPGNGDDDGVDVCRHGTSVGLKMFRPVTPAAVPLRQARKDHLVTQFSTKKQAIGLALWVLVSFIAAAIGSVASIQASSFYAQIVLPAWAPPA